MRERRPRRVRTPTILQMEATECGAAALGILLAYHGRFVPLEELRAECRVSRDGSNALYIKKAAEKYGLIGRGVQADARALCGLGAPLLVFWELNHFLVVEGFGRGVVYLNDPASGRRAVDEASFRASYTGIAFRFEPGPDFRPGGTRPNSWRSILRRMRGARPAVAFVVLAGLAVMASDLVSASYNLVFVDQVLVEERHHWIRPLLLAMGLTAAFGAAAGALQLASLRRLKLGLAMVHSAKFLWHVLRLPVAFYQQRYAGDVSGRVDGNSTVAELIAGQLATTLVGLPMVAFYAAVMWSFDPTLAAVGVAIGCLNLAGISAAGRLIRDESMKLKQIRGRLHGIMMRAIQTIETIKAGASEDETLVRLAGYQARITNADQVVGAAGALLVVLPPFLSLCSTAAVLGLGGLRVVEGLMSVGALVALQTLMVGFHRPFGDLVRLGSGVQSLQAELARLDDVQQTRLDPAFEAAPPPARGERPRLAGHLELRDVTFGYSRTIDEPLIRRLSLEVRPGSRVALVGASGSGKSTIGRLVAGLYRPWEGEILYDGRPFDAIPREVFTTQVALVDDQAFLFSGTARDNLTLWDDSVPDRELARAAIDAAIHRDLLARRGGYQAPLAEGARNLSGGQRQRMEIARALVHDPALLVLDEATASLDPVTESLVDDNIRRRGCTCLIIAHRLSTIRDCDEILVLREGRVIQRGTHDELMADRRGFYHELQTTQASLDPPRPGGPARRPAPAPGRNGKAADHPDEPTPVGAAVAATSAEAAAARARAERAVQVKRALEPHGEVVVTAGNLPLPLDDAGAVWRVESGEVDVFHVRPPEPGRPGGRRRHLCRVEEGGAIFALDGVRGGDLGGLLAVGVGPARLLRFPRADLLRLSLEPGWRRGVAEMLDDWIDRISRAAAPGDPQAGAAWLEADEPRAVAAGQLVSSRSRVLWVRVEAGGDGDGDGPGDRSGLRLFGRLPVPNCPFGSRFPLSAHAWVGLEAAATLRPRDTETLMEDGDPWVGLKRFHRVILDALAEEQGHEAKLREARLAGARMRDRARVAGALADLARLTRPGPVDGRLGERPEDGPLLEACRAVGRDIGVEVRPAPPAPGPDEGDDALRRIARASGFRTRRVRLGPDWWAADGGPLLGFHATNNRPVALLPDRKRGYVLFDPAAGTRTPVTRTVAGALEPTAIHLTPALPAEDAGPAGLLALARPAIRGELRDLLLMGTVGGVLGLAVPWATVAAVDEAIPRADRGQLALLCSFLVVVGVATAAFQALQGLALVRIKGRLEAALLPAVWDRLLNLPTRFFAREEAGDLALRAMGLARVVEVLASTAVASALLGVFSLASLAYLFALNWRLALVAVALIAVAPVATLVALPELWRCQRRIARAQGQISGLLLVLLGGIARLRAAGAERRAFARWAERYRHQLELMTRFQKLSDRLILFNDAGPQAAAMVLVAAAVALGPGAISVGDFLAFSITLAHGVAAVIGLAKGLLPLLGGLEQYERARPILEAAPEVGELRGEPVRLAGAIRLSNVSFRYEDDGPLVLDGVSLQVRPGEFVAVVGPSGSGKSTLLRLLLGFETPAEGLIAYDGRELATMDVREVRRQIGVVLQDAQLLPGDVFSNIAGASAHLSVDDAWAAAELAGLADELRRMPMGIHTVIGEGGGGLSSGQRQRLLIARALASRPRVLLLDEATSALDNHSQMVVSRSIHSRLEGTSRLAIAHRLSTVVDADRIYVLHEGKVVQAGRYAQLMAEPGLFRDLASRQVL